MLRRVALVGLVAVVAVSTAAAATPKKFTPAVLATAHITLPGNSTATTVVSLTKKVATRR